MKFKIKNRYTNAVIFTGESETIREVLESASKSGANLSGANLSGANLSCANLSGANLSCADLSGVNLRGADLRSADLHSANLHGANLHGANLHGANLRSADLSGVNLRGADLRSADLHSANLHGANLHGANLHGANLRSADLRSADLHSANLSGANLSCADLSGANLSGAYGLEFIRVDFFDVLLRASTNGEVPFLITALKAGKVDGSTYTEECKCLVGTLGDAKGCRYDAIPDLAPDSSRPAEVFFTAIRPGDTPENNGAAKIVLEWAEDFQRLMTRAKT